MRSTGYQYSQFKDESGAHLYGVSNNESSLDAQYRPESISMPLDESNMFYSEYSNNVFDDRTDIVKHITKNYFCPFCSSGFFRKQHLNNHIRVHTGEKPFCCEFCPYRSRQKVNLETHIKKKHPGI